MRSRTNLYSSGGDCYTNVLHSSNLAEAQSENFILRKDADGSRRERLLSQRTHMDANPPSHKPHSPLREKKRKKKSFLLTQLPICLRDRLHHNSRFLTKLGSAVNSTATRGRGDDNDVYEV